MSIIPEILIQKAIIRGWRTLKDDDRLMDVLFKNLNQDLLAELKAVVLNTPVDLSINYPRKETLQVPSIVILLRGEGESETFLGDHMGQSPNFDLPDPDVTVDTLDGHGASVSTLSGLPRLVVGDLSAEKSVGSAVIFKDISLTALQAVIPAIQAGKCHQLRVSAGTGAGQVHTVISAASNSLDTDATFSVQLDGTSVVDIRLVETVELVEGEPSRVYNENSFYTRRGANYSAQYQLQIIAGHQDEVVYLYSIIKALLLSQRPFFEAQGIQNFKLSGSDFAPRSEYLPSEAYTRALNMEFVYPFSFIEELEAASSIEVCLTPDDLSSPGAGDPIQIGTITL